MANNNRYRILKKTRACIHIENVLQVTGIVRGSMRSPCIYPAIINQNFEWANNGIAADSTGAFRCLRDLNGWHEILRLVKTKREYHHWHTLARCPSHLYSFCEVLCGCFKLCQNFTFQLLARFLYGCILKSYHESCSNNRAICCYYIKIFWKASIV